MSRSYRKTPIFGIACYKSLKWYKKHRTGKERRKERDAIKHGLWDILDTELEYWDEWDCPRDGKRYWKDAPEKEMRK